MRIGSVVGWRGSIIQHRKEIECRCYTSTKYTEKESFLVLPQKTDRFFVLDVCGREECSMRGVLLKVLDARGRMFWKQIWAFRSLEGGEP